MSIARKAQCGALRASSYQRVWPAPWGHHPADRMFAASRHLSHGRVRQLMSSAAAMGEGTDSAQAVWSESLGREELLRGERGNEGTQDDHRHEDRVPARGR